jgi:hypothetical protein
MPELISMMIANKYRALDRPFEKELNHQRLTKQYDLRVRIQQRQCA